MAVHRPRRDRPAVDLLRTSPACGAPPRPARARDAVEEISVRFRTVGDVSCTCPVESTAADVSAIVRETVSATLTERGATRMDDQTSEASMERRKKEGYF